MTTEAAISATLHMPLEVDGTDEHREHAWPDLDHGHRNNEREALVCHEPAYARGAPATGSRIGLAAPWRPAPTHIKPFHKGHLSASAAADSGSAFSGTSLPPPLLLPVS
jgi:hypothetical protein